MVQRLEAKVGPVQVGSCGRLSGVISEVANGHDQIFLRDN
jgi:hypothetical protein